MKKSLKMNQDNLTKTLKNFGNKWAEVSNQWDIAKIKKRQRALLKQVITKLFLKH